MKRKYQLAFMAAALALGACSNAVGPNALSDPTDPWSEEMGKEEYYNPTMPTTPPANATPVVTAPAQPDPVD